MNAAVKTRKIEAATRQISKLRAERQRLADSWLDRGWEATQEALEAISLQIVALYEEIDALEAGETSQAGRSENKVGLADEAAVSRIEADMCKRFGLTVEQLRRLHRKMVQR